MPLTNDQIYGRDALSKGEPWIVPEAITKLRELAQPSWRVFEWGSGGSLVWFSRNCRRVVCIEHDPSWLARTAKMMESFQCPDNWTLRHIEGRFLDGLMVYREYADAILKYPENSFDLISVDGEASSRSLCIKNSLPRLKPGGYMLLDNSNWFEGIPGWEKWDFVARDLHWIGQEGTFDWWTSILRKGAA
jgi:predicted O-methyltransferase YrrM